MSEKICASYCNGCCGMSFEEDDPDTWPSSMESPDSEICMDDGENHGCTEFFWENENDPCDYEEN